MNRIPNDACVTIIKKFRSYNVFGVHWLEKIRDQYYNNFDVRKRFNTYYACELLKKHNYDWLFSCDTDEFIGSFEDDIQFNIKKSLKKIDSPQVLFLARDVVYEYKKSLFQNTKFRLIRNSDYWVGKIYEFFSKVKSKLINKLYQRFFNIVFGNKITKIYLRDTSFIIPVNPSYLGHKSLINLNFYKNNNFNVHYWVDPSNHRKLNYKVLGALYHYDLLSADLVYKKFRKRTDNVALNGPEHRNFLKLMLKICPLEILRPFTMIICLPITMLIRLK